MGKKKPSKAKAKRQVHSTALVPAPLQSNSLVGSALRIAGGGAAPMARGMMRTTESDWAAAAWRFYETVGELRFASNWVGNALSRIRLYAAEEQGGGQEPMRLDDQHPAALALAEFGGGNDGQAEMLRRLGVIMTISGSAYVVGEPADDFGTIADANWIVMSGSELKQQGRWADGNPKFLVNEGAGPRKLHPDTLITRIWRSHPRNWWEADSPTRGALPVLAELELLTQHILASARSRLAGKGILVFPQEISFPAAGPHTNPQSAATDPFFTELTEVMMAAIDDPTSPAATVPIVLKLPGEWADKIKHITLEFPLDAQAKDLRDEAIRRMAAAMDVPSEIVLGLGDVNHWSAWQLSEQAITVHIIPLATLIVDAFTTHFLHPVLEAMGVDTQGLAVWFDTTPLTQRPNQAQDAKDLFDRGAIGLDALRTATGFADDDAPDPRDEERQLLIRLVTGAPSLAPCLLPILGIDVPASCGAPAAEAPAEAPAGADDSSSGTPDTQDAPPPSPNDGVPASALVAACDMIVQRAVERAGARLKTHLTKAKKLDGYATVPTCELHVALGGVPAGACADLLAGAWSQLDAVCARYGPAEVDFVATRLDAMTRSLLTSGTAYDPQLILAAITPPVFIDA